MVLHYKKVTILWFSTTGRHLQIFLTTRFMKASTTEFLSTCYNIHSSNTG